MCTYRDRLKKNGCVKRAPAARGGRDARITQPRDPSLADPCTYLRLGSSGCFCQNELYLPRQRANIKGKRAKSQTARLRARRKVGKEIALFRSLKSVGAGARSIGELLSGWVVMRSPTFPADLLVFNLHYNTDLRKQIWEYTHA